MTNQISKVEQLILEGKIRTSTERIKDDDTIGIIASKIYHHFQVGQQVTFKKMIHSTAIGYKDKTMMINIGDYVLQQLCEMLAFEASKPSASRVRWKEPKGTIRIGVDGTKLFKCSYNVTGTITIWRAR